MKRKLLCLIGIITSFVYAQSPINNFNSEPLSQYATVNSTPEIDQSASGTGLTWNFTNFTSTETSTDTYAAPTAGQLTTYPGSTSVFTTTQDSSGDETIIFGKQSGTEVSLTGAEGTEFSLNYNSDNALIGTFPLSYAYNNIDTVSGSYNYDGGTAAINGTFSGNIVVTVDAYGTLNMNDVGGGTFSGNVTRLKIVQTVSLSIPPFIPNAGTATQTSYYYYHTNTGYLVFRSNSVHLLVPIFSVDETTNVYESLITNLLDVNETIANEISVVPNPVNDVLNVSLKNQEPIKSIIVTDINGRQILSSTNNTTTIDVSRLQAGMYILTLQTDTAILTHKFIKK